MHHPLAMLSLWIMIALVGCDSSEERAFDTLPVAREEIDPSGQWVRSDGAPLGLLIYEIADDVWIVESRGQSALGQGGNACWKVAVGQVQAQELVTSSDVDLDFRDAPGRDLALIVEVRGDKAKVMDPASSGDCPLGGIYDRRQGLSPTVAYHTAQNARPE